MFPAPLFAAGAFSGVILYSRFLQTEQILCSASKALSMHLERELNMVILYITIPSFRHWG